MENKKKKNIKKICLASGAATVAFGAASAGIVYSVIDKQTTNYTLTWDNVYSIRDFTLHAYNKYLSSSGLSTTMVAQKLNQVKSDMEAIINNGKAGGFSVEHVYSAIHTYAANCQISVVDWKMVDDFITASLNNLKTVIGQTDLSKDKKEELYLKYANNLNAKVTQVKKQATSSSDAFILLKNYGKELAAEELKEQKETLLSYFAHDFFSSHKFALSSYWDESAWLNGLQLGDEINLGYIYAGSSEGLTSTGTTSKNFAGNLSQNVLQKIYGEENQYKLKANFVRKDNTDKTIIVKFKITDQANNNEWISDNITVQSFFSPEYNKAQVEQLMQQNQLSLSHLNLQEWVSVVAAYLGITPQEYHSQPIDDSHQYSEPIYQEVGINSTRSLFLVNGTDSLADSKYDDLLKKVTISLKIFAIDTDRGKVDYEITALSNAGQGLTSNGTQPAEDEDAPDTATTDADYTVVVHPRSSTETFPLTDEASIGQLKEHFDIIHKTIKQSDKAIVDNIYKLYVTNTVLAAEQAAMAIICGVFAGIYFAAAAPTLGITIPPAIMATVGAAGCLAGSIISTWCAVEYKKQYDYVDQMRKAPGYEDFIKQAKDFVKSDEGRIISSSAFRISFTSFVQISQKVYQLARALQMLTSGSTGAAIADTIATSAAGGMQVSSPVARYINTFGHFALGANDGPFVRGGFWQSLSAIRTFRNSANQMVTFDAASRTAAFGHFFSGVGDLLDGGRTEEAFLADARRIFDTFVGQGGWERFGQEISLALFRRQTTLDELSHFFQIRALGGGAQDLSAPGLRAMSEFMDVLGVAETAQLPDLVRAVNSFQEEMQIIGERFLGYAQRVSAWGTAPTQVAAQAAEFAEAPLTALAFDSEQEFRLFCRDLAFLTCDGTTFRSANATVGQFPTIWRNGIIRLMAGGIGSGAHARITNGIGNEVTRQMLRATSFEEAGQIGERAMIRNLAQQGLIRTVMEGDQERVLPLAGGRGWGLVWVDTDVIETTEVVSPYRVIQGVVEGVAPANNTLNAMQIPQQARQVSEHGVVLTPALGSREYNGGIQADVYDIGGVDMAAYRSAAVAREVSSDVIFSSILSKYEGGIRWWQIFKAGSALAELRAVLKSEEMATAIYKPIIYTAAVSVPPVECLLGLFDLAINIVGIVLQSVWS